MNPQSNLTVEVEKPEPANRKSSIHASRNRPRLWLVDDSDEYRELLAEMLARDAGFECTRQFSSPQAALAALAEEVQPDLILLDVQMGEECGLDAIQPIKALAPSTHVVMLTTCFDHQYRARARRSGATDFLLKSYAVEEISRRILEALEQPIPKGEAGVEVSVGGEQPRVAKSGKNSFPHREPSAHGFAGWKLTWSRILRGAFLVRSRLTMFF